MKILFFGSTTDSVIISSKIWDFLSTVNCQLSAVITQPPRPIGRNLIITPTPVEVWAKERNIRVFSFETNKDKPWLYQDETAVIGSIFKLDYDLAVTACYGQKIPDAVLDKARFGGINVHPSLLPKWRGADPVPWTILAGDKRAGVSVVTINEKFDQGDIIAQESLQLKDDEHPDPLRTKLFEIGAELSIRILDDLLNKKVTLRQAQGLLSTGNNRLSTENDGLSTPYARRFSREDGYVPWEILQILINNGQLAKAQISNVKIINELVNQKIIQDDTSPSIMIERMVRGLSPWPGVWTMFKITVDSLQLTEEKRLKILKCHTEDNKLILDQVQLEGKKPTSFNEFNKAYHAPDNQQ